MPLAFFGTFFRFERKYCPPRGGSPTAKDRVMATRMGYEAVRVLAEGKTNRVVAYKHGEFLDFDIQEALNMKKDIPEDQYEISKLLIR